MSIVKPVILCGGTGTRLWPLSRSDYPKQFVDFPKAGVLGNSLFRYALRRLKSRSPNIRVLPPTVIASSSYRFFVQEQIREADAVTTVFLEPVARNTAASLTMAALIERDKDPILVVLPSDQALDDAKLNLAVAKAIPACEAGHIVLLGIRPNYPETGYGYIKAEGTPAVNDPSPVDRFVEKPDEETAKFYVKEGTYLWNSGIFILKASSWLNALRLCRPDIARAAQDAWDGTLSHISDTEMTVDRDAFLRIPSESVDYAVLEHAKSQGLGLDVIAFDGYWTDLGSWKSVFNAIPKDPQGNFATGQVLLQDTCESLAISLSRPVALNGVQNVAVIETSDAVLVCDLIHSQSVKEIVVALKEKGLYQAVEHRKGRRPWGWCDSIDQGDGFKVKRIVVYPGASLSLQRHRRRAEHWVVVKGEAIVQVGESVRVVKTNESIYIPKTEVHRLTNTTDSEIQLIEVQIGDYLGEDDIERLEDLYGRS